MSKLKTKQIDSITDLQAFFDQCAQNYSEQHGHPEHLLNYRIRLLKQFARIHPNDVILDIGCGNGHHLFALADEIGCGIGIDLSPAMIEAAREHLQNSSWQEKISFHAENAEELSTITDHSVDLAMCIGSFEHMFNKSAVLTNVYRVLKPSGRFICLTPNGDYLWYRFIAPLLKLDTKHLSTDEFLSRTEMEHLHKDSGFCQVDVGYWTFIPKGDMHPALGWVLQSLDRFGRLFRINSLRGGLLLCSWKPSTDFQHGK